MAEVNEGAARPAPRRSLVIGLGLAVAALVAFPFAACHVMSVALSVLEEAELGLPAFTMLVLGTWAFVPWMFWFVLAPLLVVGALLERAPRARTAMWAGVTAIAGLTLVLYIVALLLPFLKLGGGLSP